MMRNPFDDASFLMHALGVMSRADKLIAKLKEGRELTIDEAETILRRLGFVLDLGKGSHRVWRRSDGKRVTIASHNKSLPRYQAREILTFL